MLRHFTLCFFAFSSCIASNAQTFEQSIQGNSAQFGTALAATSDGGFILAGYTQAFGIVNGYDNVYLVRTDGNGDTLWTRAFSGTGTDQGFAVAQTSDGGFLVAGTSNSFGGGDKDVLLVRTDASGDPLWSKTYGGSGEDAAYDIALTPDGGAIMAGQSGVSGGAGGGLNTYVIRIDAAGDTLWTRTFNSGSDNYAYSVGEVTGGDHIIAGVGAFGIWYMELMRIDDNGDLVWNKAMTTGYAAAYSAVETSDGGLIVAGVLGEAGLVKTDANGDTLWTRIYNGPSNDYAYSVQQTPDGGYVFSGENLSHTWLVRTDSNGDTLWQHTYSSGNAELNQVVLTDDGGFAVCANRHGGAGSGGYAMQLVRTGATGMIPCNMLTPAVSVTTAALTINIPTLVVASYGAIGTPSVVVGSGAIVVTPCTTVGIVEASHRAAISVYPDPTTSAITISTIAAIDQVQLFDATGRSVPLIMLDPSTRTFDVSGLDAGLYFLRCSTKDRSLLCASFVKEQ